MDENVLGNVVGSLIDKNKDDWGGGSGFIWVILMFFLFGGYGFGGNRGNNATTQDVATSQMFGQIDNGIRNLSSGQAALGYDNLKQSADSNMMIQGGFANITQALADNRFAQQSCCCETNRNIDSMKYENAQQTNLITMNDAQNTQKILDKLCQMESNAKDNTIAQLRQDLQAAQLTIGNANQTSNIIAAVRPTPVPAYITSSPYASYYGGTAFA